MSKLSKPEQVRQLIQREVREIDRDLRAMERATKHIQWLMGRDSNCGNAASLIDACEHLGEEMKSLSDELKESLAGPFDGLVRESKHLIVDSICCSLHNNGYGLQGNTAEYDEEWFARALWCHVNGEVPGLYDVQTDDVKEHWLKISKAAIETLPGLMGRIANRAILHSQALRTIERGYRIAGKKS